MILFHFMRPALLPLLLAAALFPAGAGAATTSKLWGTDGSGWNSASRLPDFSFAGYHCGEKPIPEVAVAASVRQFGAVGDGKADDTEAFRKAIAATAKGAILIPAGRYVLTGQIEIAKSGVVLRGEGIGKTVLVIPKSMEQIHGAKTVDERKSSWAFGGGFIEIRGRSKDGKLTDVAEPAKRGDRRLALKEAAGIAPGSWVRLLMNNDPALGRHLHAGQKEIAEQTRKEIKHLYDWVARVVAVNGKTVTLDRPLRLDVKPEWQAELWSWQPALEESGVESLSFEFAGTPKRPHLREEGFNAIQMSGAVNCWVRNVEIMDADNGVIVGGCRFCTVEALHFRAVKRDGKRETGHHALWATGRSQDCLFSGFRLKTKFVHDLSVEGCACGNVFERGSGVAIDFDHHSNAPYENLFTEIKVGKPYRLWNCGGRGDRGPHTAARTTFWNLEFKDEADKVPKVPDWPQINVIGVPGLAVETTSDHKWVEPCAGGVVPPNLYRAQLEHRLTTTKTGATP